MRRLLPHYWGLRARVLQLLPGWLVLVQVQGAWRGNRAHERVAVPWPEMRLGKLPEDPLGEAARDSAPDACPLGPRQVVLWASEHVWEHLEFVPAEAQRRRAGNRKEPQARGAQRGLREAARPRPNTAHVAARGPRSTLHPATNSSAGRGAEQGGRMRARATPGGRCRSQAATSPSPSPLQPHTQSHTQSHAARCTHSRAPPVWLHRGPKSNRRQW